MAYHGLTAPAPLPNKARKAGRRIAGRLCLDIGRNTSSEVREYLLRKYQGDAEAGFADLLKIVDGKCVGCGGACGHSDAEYIGTRMRAIEAYFKIAGVVSPDVTLNVFAAMGVRNEEEAKRRVEITQEADSMTDADRLEVACGVVVDLSRSAPELIRRCAQVSEVMEALGSALSGIQDKAAGDDGAS